MKVVWLVAVLFVASTFALTYPPQIDIRKVQITKFNIKVDYDEDMKCKLLLKVGEEPPVHDITYPAEHPECEPCPKHLPFGDNYPQGDNEPLFQDREALIKGLASREPSYIKLDPNARPAAEQEDREAFLIQSSKPAATLDLPADFNRRYYKTWSSTSLAKEHVRQARKRNFFPHSTEEEPDNQNPLNFWRVNELINANLQQRELPYSAIVKLATIDETGRVVHCTGAVIGQSTIVTAPQCVYKAEHPPLVFTGYHGGNFEHLFFADQIWIPGDYDPCTFSDFNAPVDVDDVKYSEDLHIPLPSQGSFALLHVHPNYFRKNFFFDIGAVTGTLGLGAIYLPDIATFPGYDLTRAKGEELNILTGNVKLVYNRKEWPEPHVLQYGREWNTSFYDDFFNIQGMWEARGAAAIVNPGSEDLAQGSSSYWLKERNVVAGVVARFESDIDFLEMGYESEQSPSHTVSSSGSMFGIDFTHFYYEYCDRGCERDCFVDHVCGNGIIDDLNPWNEEETEVFLDFYPPFWMPEECDDGLRLNSNRPNAHCRPNCSLARCGDRIVDTDTEECDRGVYNGLNNSDCTENCTKIPLDIEIVNKTYETYGWYLSELGTAIEFDRGESSNNTLLRGIMDRHIYLELDLTDIGYINSRDVYVLDGAIDSFIFEQDPRGLGNETHIIRYFPSAMSFGDFKFTYKLCVFFEFDPHCPEPYVGEVNIRVNVRPRISDGNGAGVYEPCGGTSDPFQIFDAYGYFAVDASTVVGPGYSFPLQKYGRFRIFEDGVPYPANGPCDSLAPTAEVAALVNFEINLCDCNDDGRPYPFPCVCYTWPDNGNELPALGENFIFENGNACGFPLCQDSVLVKYDSTRSFGGIFDKVYQLCALEFQYTLCSDADRTNCFWQPGDGTFPTQTINPIHDVDLESVNQDVYIGRVTFAGTANNDCE